jgi:hypothetical protein
MRSQWRGGGGGSARGSGWHYDRRQLGEGFEQRGPRWLNTNAGRAHLCARPTCGSDDTQIRSPCCCTYGAPLTESRGPQPDPQVVVPFQDRPHEMSPQIVDALGYLAAVHLQELSTPSPHSFRQFMLTGFRIAAPLRKSTQIRGVPPSRCRPRGLPARVRRTASSAPCRAGCRH